MKRKTFTLAALLAAALTGSAQTTYFHADFEEGMPEGMTFYDVDQNEPSADMQRLGFAVGTPWIVTVPDEQDGNHVAASTSWYKKGATSDDWMVLPLLTVADARAKLQWRSRATDKDYRDGLTVCVATVDAAAQVPGAASEAWTQVFSVAKESYDWQQHEVDLSAYAGQTVYVAFVNKSKDRMMLLVDDVFVGVPSNVGLELSFDRCFDGYGEVAISGRAVGSGTEAVDRYTIGFEVDGQTVEQTFEQRLTPGDRIDFTLDDRVTLERNHEYAYRAWIASGDDRSELSGRFWAVPWKLVCEEVTGTWCQFCVRGIGAMNEMRQTAPDGFIGIAIHNNGTSNVPDSMAIEGEAYLEWVMKTYAMGGFPNCVINRSSAFAIDPGNIPYYYENIKAYYRHDTGVEAHAAYDPATGLVSVSTQALFTKSYEEAGFRLFYVVVENQVHRSHADNGILSDYNGYDQINAYAGGSQGKCYGYEDLPYVLNADDMWYNDVARGTWPTDDFRGVAGVFPRTIAAGDIHSYECSFSLPEKIHHVENCEVVVMLLDKDGRFMNADKAALTVAGAEAVASVEQSPEAADGRVFDLQGRRVAAAHASKGLYIVGGRKVVR